MDPELQELKAKAYVTAKAARDPAFRAKLESQSKVIEGSSSQSLPILGWLILAALYGLFRALSWAFGNVDFGSKNAVASIITVAFFVLSYLVYYLYTYHEKLCGYCILATTGLFIFNLVRSDASFTSFEDVSMGTLMSHSLEVALAATGSIAAYRMIKRTRYSEDD